VEPKPPASVLVLEDDDAYRRFVVRVLSGAGYSVVDTGDAREAMQLVNGGAMFDLLVADVQMPMFQPHGINVGNFAMSKPHGPKVIYITGSPAEVPKGFVDEARTPILGKPIQPQTLIAAVKAALGARA
jgi:CheY-like chemotaxis protein